MINAAVRFVQAIRRLLRRGWGRIIASWEATINPPNKPIASLRRSFLLLAAIPVIAVAGLAAGQWQQDQRHALNQLNAATRFAAVTTRDFIESYERGLTMLSRQISTQPALLTSPAGQRELLSEFTGSFGHGAHLNLLGPDEKLLATSTVYPGQLPNFGTYPIIRGELGRADRFPGVAVGTPLMGPIVHHWMIPLRLAIRDRNGVLLGYLGAPIPVRLLFARLKHLGANNTKLYAGEEIVVLRKNGIILALFPRPTGKAWLIPMKPVHGPLMREAARSPSMKAGDFHGVAASNGLESFGSWRRVAHGGLIIGIGVPTRALRGEFLKWLRPILAGLVFVLGCVALTYGVLARSTRQRSAVARLDALTGLSNRCGLFEHLEKLLAGSGRNGDLVAIAMFDLDGFKEVNDTHGHACGDAVLRTLGTRLQNAARARDFVARLGGDEFVLVVEELSGHADLPPILDRLVTAIEHPIILPNGVVVRIRASCGAAFFPCDDQTSQGLLACADQALYAVKRTRTPREHSWGLYDSECDTARRRTAMLGLLRSGGLRLHYQPIVHLDNGALVEVEALARLADGSELLSPARFLPAFATADRLELAIAVLRRATHDLVSWTAQGLGSFGIAVNVEPDVLVLPEFQTALQQVIKTQNLAPARITIEILESGTFHSEEAAKKCVSQLRALGVRISLDDIGTGYSSLGRIRELSVDQVKLDQSFVADLMDHPDNVGFIVALQVLTRSLHIQLVIEGIEHPRVLDALETLGVDCAQGYLLSRPMSSEQLIEWLAPPNQVSAPTVSRFPLICDRCAKQNFCSCPDQMNARQDGCSTFLPRQGKTLFGAYVAHLFNYSMLALNPGLLTRLPDLGDSHRCRLGQYIDSQGLYKTELGETHAAYHRMLTSEAIDSPAFRAVTTRLSQLILATIAADDAMENVAAYAGQE